MNTDTPARDAVAELVAGAGAVVSPAVDAFVRARAEDPHSVVRTVLARLSGGMRAEGAPAYGLGSARLTVLDVLDRQVTVVVTAD
ncbi:hypothetical protein C1701_14055 [Actinoalloteichus sp. AHMU CJ021]|uniref:Uncharacterized protein n=1 Tax=Actinoalloteichus caeruleus DSM 43889 TaxID=1120930 RepID=A0ABT1JM23_ACTCY|nr:hypothetical protein [Actinoalloteichus caeruleus]AUS79301.1 hypothetical protein C1701_14055 [Actinoalloteichus sp. AHMU CJ021]MCP2333576.1 hypothetical protein [Actinoalloteichus caeruleus DSM 43889]